MKQGLERVLLCKDEWFVEAALGSVLGVQHE